MESIKEQEVFFLMTIAILLMLSLAIAFVVFYSRSRQKMLREEMKAQALLLQHTIIAQEEERSRIAKDLHDEIGSKLNVIFLHTQRLKKVVDDPQKTQDISTDLTNIINTAIDATRRIAHDLLPPTIEEFGLVVALKELRDTFLATDALNVSLDIQDDKLTITDKMVELNVFRIIQELLNNSLKHGQAQNVLISFVLKQEAMCVKYKDDGNGVDLQQLKKNKGLGMRSIESRLQIINGEWTYESSPGNGLQAELIIKI